MIRTDRSYSTGFIVRVFFFFFFNKKKRRDFYILHNIYIYSHASHGYVASNIKIPPNREQILQEN